MKTQNFGLLYFLMVLGQLVLCNFVDLSPFLTLTMLPAMVMCVPLTVSTPLCLLLAFATGLSVDWLSEGLIGINAAALVPVALMRKPLIRFFLGEDIITRSDSFSIRKNGIAKIAFIMLLATLIHLGIYVYLDGAGIRPTWFNLTRIGVSLACNYILAIIVTNTLTTDDRK